MVTYQVGQSNCHIALIDMQACRHGLLAPAVFVCEHPFYCQIATTPISRRCNGLSNLRLCAVKGLSVIYTTSSETTLRQTLSQP